MPKTGAVWGIDIGQSALKALRCRSHEKDTNRIVADAFDYIEYSKILSQPEADRDSLIAEAIEQFLSRNEVKGDRVAVSVPGQSGLARFIKLPPVEKKKIPDIVRYEARQQIPFALEDVVWDYQPLAGSNEDEGYALETEVGLFAMKRDQVARALQPFEDAGIDVDCVQLSPLAIYNFVCFDRLGNLEDAAPYNPEKPPASTVVISLGTDTTDLVITNGYRVWQRNIPIGGNHFTKALSKELRLTFSKAEHLKRNAMKAEDPKAVFQAMRPVFSDLVAEIQRSLGFFTSNNRQATLGDVIALGNPMKLPGLQRYLSQNLDQEIKAVDDFTALVSGTATSAPQFKENQLSFPVAYGLCVQALGLSQLSTNLLPEEIVTTRLVRAKKPWAVAAAALLMTGMAVNYASHHAAWKSADIQNPEMSSALSNSQNWTSTAGGFKSNYEALKAEFDTIVETGHALQSNVDGRLLWLEVLKAVDAALPRDPRPVDERQETAEDVMQRPELHIESMDCEYFEDISQWFANVERYYTESREEYQYEPDQPPPAGPAAQDAAGDGVAGDGAAGDGTAASEQALAGDPAAAGDADPGSPDAAEDQLADDGATDPAGTDDLVADAETVDEFGGDELADDEEGGAGGGPTGEGWVIQLKGFHFHNTDPRNEGEQFIKNTLIRNLEEGTVKLPDGPPGQLIDVPIADLGIGYPVVVTKNPIQELRYSPEATSADELGRIRSAAMAAEQAQAPGAAARRRVRSNQEEEEVKPPEFWDLRRYDFVIQFSWSPTPRSERIRKAAEAAGAAEGESGEDEAFDTADTTETQLR